MNDPVFIVGAPRSGTTLLSQLITSYSDIFIYNESVYYDFIETFCGNKKDGVAVCDAVYNFLVQKIVFAQEKEVDKGFGCVFTFDEVEQVRSKFDAWYTANSGQVAPVDVFSNFLRITSEIKSKSHWGEKTPNNVYHLGAIVQDFPTAKIIHVVRDPRKFLRSYKYAWAVRGAKNPDAAKRLYHPAVTSWHWKKSVNSFRKLLQARNGYSCLEVKFEDLLAGPQKTMDEVFAFLGVEPTGKAALPTGSNTSFQKEKRELQDWEKNTCEYICKNEIKAYGYFVTMTTFRCFFSFLRSTLSLPLFIFSVYPLLKERYGGSLFRYIGSRVFGATHK